MLDIYNELNQLVRDFEKNKISYCVIGGLAVSIYGGMRSTQDIDFFISLKEIEKVSKILQNNGYIETTDSCFFKDKKLKIYRYGKSKGEDEELTIVDILVSEEERYNQILTNSHELEWGQGVIRIANKEDLIFMKEHRKSKLNEIDIQVLKGKND